eukprot:ANDGO_07900.mRNA.1 hypothetical protein AURANDRAFT_65998
MLLDVIESASSHRRSSSFSKVSNRVDDIPGAHPCTTAESRYIYMKMRPASTARCDDINGAAPASLSYSTSFFGGGSSDSSSSNNINSSNSSSRHIGGTAIGNGWKAEERTRNLSNDDIPFSKPRKSVGFVTTRCTDPLSPAYSLPTVSISKNYTFDASATQIGSACQTVDEHRLKMKTRDVMSISDIAGTRPAPLYRFPQRKTSMDISDLEGARPRHAPERTGHVDPILNVKDINGDGLFKSSRVADPLSPRYRYDVVEAAGGSKAPGYSIVASSVVRSGEDGEFIGKVDGSHSRVLHKARARGPIDNSLQTRDLGESASPSRGHRVFPPADARRQIRNTNHVADIEGTAIRERATTFAHASHRHANPLAPVYGRAETDDFAVKSRSAEWASKRREPLFVYGQIENSTQEISAVKNLPK